jgi:type IV secretion system protein TrbI
VSKRAAGVVIALAAIILGLFAYGGYQRRQRQVAALATTGVSRGVSPATAAGAEISKTVPSGMLMATPLDNVPSTDGTLQPPGELQPAQQIALNSGAPQRGPANVPPPLTSQPNPEPTPEQRRLIAAFEAEQQAMLAPTALRPGFGQQNGGRTTGSISAGIRQQATDQPGEIGNLIRSLTSVASRDGSRPVGSHAADDADRDQTSQDQKEAFLAKARSSKSADYLKSTRTPPLSPYEIKSGWEIPAVLEQALNSDLPGELKALVSANVYDTANGRYLLIPQGSRLVGTYDSRIGYGQEVAQVVWDRVIYPDGSSLDLSGMIGQDVHGMAGFRDKVDRHYRRLVGFAVLTSMFAVASDLAQSRNRSLLTYPSSGEIATAAVGREVSEVGAQITRRNLNVQPTIKVPIGYRFNVRVNRDILFDAPYMQTGSGEK